MKSKNKLLLIVVCYLLTNIW